MLGVYHFYSWHIQKPSDRHKYQTDLWSYLGKFIKVFSMQYSMSRSFLQLFEIPFWNKWILRKAVLLNQFKDYFLNPANSLIWAVLNINGESKSVWWVPITVTKAKIKSNSLSKTDAIYLQSSLIYLKQNIIWKK